MPRIGNKPSKKVHINAGGRCSEALLEGEALMKGHYELVFHVGAYSTENAPYHPLSAPSFLNDIPIRFLLTAHWLITTFLYWSPRGVTRPIAAANI